MAMAAVVTTEELADSFAANVLHLNTYSGNPLATAVAESVLDVIQEEKMQERSALHGEAMISRLGALRSEFECVGDVRGKGWMIGIEMVTDKESKRPLPADAMIRIHERIKDMGVIIGRGGLTGNIFRIKPPMCVDAKDSEFAFQVLHRALAEYESGVL